MKEGFIKRSIVRTRSWRHVYIDTRKVPGYGYETMVFNCDKDGNVKSWMDIDCRTYQTEEEAEKGHKEVVEKWMSQ